MTPRSAGQVVTDAGFRWYAVVVDPFRPLTRWLLPLLSHPRMPAVRALLIALHLLAVVAVACPAPVRTMNAEAWQRPAVRDELEGWSSRLGAVGIAVSPDALRDLSSDVQRRWIEARSAVVWPFQKWLRAVNAPQGWYMFTGPDRDPQRLFVAFTSSSSPKGEQLVFEAGRPPARPDLINADFINDHRVRRAMFQTSWGRSESTFRAICAALATRVRARATDRDAVDDVVCRLVGRRVEHPHQRDAPRPERVARELLLHKDGTSTERKDGSPVRTRPARRSSPKSTAAPTTPLERAP